MTTEITYRGNLFKYVNYSYRDGIKMTLYRQDNQPGEVLFVYEDDNGEILEISEDNNLNILTKLNSRKMDLESTQERNRLRSNRGNRGRNNSIERRQTTFTLKNQRGNTNNNGRGNR